MPQPASVQTLASYLGTGYWREGGSVPHRFDTSGGPITVSLGGLTADGQALARAALGAWSMVADLSFREVGGGADITIDDARAGASSAVAYTTAGETLEARVNVGTAWLAAYGTDLGSYSFQTFLHEIGHALGLGHPGRYNTSADFATDAKFANDVWQYTVMSYFSQVENTGTGGSYATALSPMLADVLAIQSLYGAQRGGATAGDTRWGVGSDLGGHLGDAFAHRGASLRDEMMTIWDAGGTDVIDLSDDEAAQRLDLRAGAFSDVYGLRGNLAVALGTQIENARAGSGNDRVTGNDAANRIEGGAGRDELSGLGGDDRLGGGAGNDRLLGGAGRDGLDGAAGADALKGGAGADRLSGGAGGDQLAGGAGDDQLAGGAGADRFVFDGGRDVVLDWEAGLDRLVLEGVRQSLEAVLARAEVVRGALTFDLGGGDVLRLAGVRDVAALGDDLVLG